MVVVVVLLILLEPGVVAVLPGAGVEVALEACTTVIGLAKACFGAVFAGGLTGAAEVTAAGSDSVTELLLSPAPGAGGLPVWPHDRDTAAKNAALPQTSL